MAEARASQSGSTGAANRSFYGKTGMPDMAGRDPPESATPTSTQHARPITHDRLLLPISTHSGVVW